METLDYYDAIGFRTYRELEGIVQNVFLVAHALRPVLVSCRNRPGYVCGQNRGRRSGLTLLRRVLYPLSQPWPAAATSNERVSMRHIAGAMVALLVGSGAQASQLSIRVSNVLAVGDVYVQVCTAGEFGKACALRARARPQRGQTLVRFPNVAPGQYAVSVFQDTDGNGRLTFGMSGAPSEPWGYSRAAKAVMGPAEFKDAVIAVGPGTTVVAVALGH